MTGSKLAQNKLNFVYVYSGAVFFQLHEDAQEYNRTEVSTKNCLGTVLTEHFTAWKPKNLPIAVFFCCSETSINRF